MSQSSFKENYQHPNSLEDGPRNQNQVIIKILSAATIAIISQFMEEGRLMVEGIIGG